LFTLHCQFIVTVAVAEPLDPLTDCDGGFIDTELRYGVPLVHDRVACSDELPFNETPYSV